MKTKILSLAPQPHDLPAHILSEAEHTEFARLLHGPEKTRRRMARALAKKELACELGVSPCELVILKSETGKPFLPHHSRLRFSLSHSGQYLALAYGPHECGIDIEEIRPLPEQAAIEKRIFSTAEQATPPSTDSLCAFYQAWTRKEAYLKALGTGFSTDPRTLCTCAAEASGTWQIATLQAPAGYAAAIAWAKYGS